MTTEDILRHLLAIAIETGVDDDRFYNVSCNVSFLIEITPRIEPTIVRICEICGGSTESSSNHICKSCAMQIRKLLRENREVKSE